MTDRAKRKIRYYGTFGMFMGDSLSNDNPVYYGCLIGIYKSTLPDVAI